MPFFSLFVGLAVAVESFVPVNWLIYTAKQIGFGFVVGIIIGWVGGWLLGETGRRGWIDESLQQLGLLMLAVACYGGAGFMDGNGFIAAFVGGLLVKSGFEEAPSPAANFSEAWRQLLNYFVFFIFGMIVTRLLPVFGSQSYNRAHTSGSNRYDRIPLESGIRSIPGMVWPARPGIYRVRYDFPGTRSPSKLRSYHYSDRSRYGVTQHLCPRYQRSSWNQVVCQTNRRLG